MMKLNLEKMGSFLQLHLELKISHLWLVGWLGTMDWAYSRVVTVQWTFIFSIEPPTKPSTIQHFTSNQFSTAALQVQDWQSSPKTQNCHHLTQSDSSVCPFSRARMSGIIRQTQIRYHKSKYANSQILPLYTTSVIISDDLTHYFTSVSPFSRAQMSWLI